MIETNAGRITSGVADRLSITGLEDQEDEVSCESCSDKRTEMFELAGNCYYNPVNSSSLIQIIIILDSVT